MLSPETEWAAVWTSAAIWPSRQAAFSNEHCKRQARKTPRLELSNTLKTRLLPNHRASICTQVAPTFRRRSEISED